MQLSKVVRSSRELLEFGQFTCAALTVVFSTYLFASYSRFLQGERIGADFIRGDVRGDVNPFVTTNPHIYVYCGALFQHLDWHADSRNFVFVEEKYGHEWPPFGNGVL